MICYLEATTGPECSSMGSLGGPKTSPCNTAPRAALVTSLHLGAMQGVGDHL